MQASRGAAIASRDLDGSADAGGSRCAAALRGLRQLQPHLLSCCSLSAKATVRVAAACTKGGSESVCEGRERQTQADRCPEGIALCMGE
eukprot:6207422-Pleurochrysis_carterae.AAC.6